MVSLEEVEPTFEEQPLDLLCLDEALTKLSGFDARKSRLVELRFFGGLTAKEAAEMLQVSLTTVEREWRLARMWLLAELDGRR